jgi:hypothetical protein
MLKTIQKEKGQAKTIAWNPDSAAFAVSGADDLLVILPLWLVLRIIDWMFGGPARRRAWRAQTYGRINLWGRDCGNHPLDDHPQS